MEKHDTHLLSCSSSEEHSYILDNINENTPKNNSNIISKLNVENQSINKNNDKIKNTRNYIENNDPYNTEFTILSNGVRIKKIKINATIIPRKVETENKNIIFNDNQKLLIIKKSVNRSFMTKITKKSRKNRRKISRYNPNNYFRYSSTQKISTKIKNFPNPIKNEKSKLLLFQKNNSEKNLKKKNEKNIPKEIIPKKINYLRNTKKRAMSSYSNLKSRKLTSDNSKIKETIYDNTEFFTELKQLKNALQNESSMFNNNTNNNYSNNYSYHLIYPRDPSPLLEERLSCNSILFPKTTNNNNKFEIENNSIYKKHYGEEKNCPLCISAKSKYIIPNMKSNNLNFVQIKKKRAMSSYTKKNKHEINSFNRLTNTNKNYDDRWGNFVYSHGSNNLSDVIGGEKKIENYYFIEKYFKNDNINENFNDNGIKIPKLK